MFLQVCVLTQKHGLIQYMLVFLNFDMNTGYFNIYFDIV